MYHQPQTLLGIAKLAYKRGEDRYKRKYEGDELAAYQLEKENKQMRKDMGLNTVYAKRHYPITPVPENAGIGEKLMTGAQNKARRAQHAGYASAPPMLLTTSGKPDLMVGEVGSFLKLIGKNPKKVDPLVKRRLHGEVIRHEIDEHKFLGDTPEIDPKDPKLMNSHMNPRVIINESNRMINAPEPVRKIMTDLRVKGAPGMGGLNGMMFNMFRPEQKNIRDVIPHFEYGKTFVNEADAAAIEHVYGLHRQARIDKFDKLLDTKVLGKQPLKPTGPVWKTISTNLKRMI